MCDDRGITDLIPDRAITAEAALAIAGFAAAMAVATVDVLHLPARPSPLTRTEFVRLVVSCAFQVGISAGLVAAAFGAEL